ncbi:MAG: hypothetical protein NTV88_05760 [Candidatus Micrarchaeota archaeon]|nr:hypothetical protein [Candidatus Micrarchaeota archaeon]
MKFTFVSVAVCICLCLILLSRCAGQMAKIGKFGSAHEHADFKVYIDDVAYNFSQEKYMSPSVNVNGVEDCGSDSAVMAHLHNGDGNLAHKHATGVTWAYFFSKLGMNMTDTCFTLDNGTSYCNNDAAKWRFFLNGTVTQSLPEQEIHGQDRALFTYGASDSQAQQQMRAVTYEAVNEDTGDICSGGVPVVKNKTNSSA